MNHALLFFPGIVIHELGHFLACVLTGTRVRSVQWVSSEGGFVVHDRPATLAGVLISVAPFLLNNALGIFLWMQALRLFSVDPLLALVLAWAAFSLLLFCFPSSADGLNAFNGVKDSLARKILHGPVLERFLWLVLSPVLFLPALLIAGLLMLIEQLTLVSVLWAIGLMAAVAAGAI